MTAEWTPLDTADRLIRRWPLVAALVLLGGLIGLVLAQTRQPVYEAAVPLAASIDYSRSGPLKEIEQEYALDHLMALVDHSARLAEIQQRLQAEGLQLSAAEIASRLRLDRQGFSLRLTARDADARTAGQIALAWANITRANIEQASRQALQAEAIQSQLDALAACPEASCPELAEESRQLASALAEARLEAGELPPFLLVNLDAASQVETRRVDAQNLWAAAGMALGLLLAVWLVESSRGR